MKQDRKNQTLVAPPSPRASGAAPDGQNGRSERGSAPGADSRNAVAAAAARRYFPLLLLLFAGSGCSALIYEIVWYQLLQLVIGSSAISLGVLLATFMGGLCLGSIMLQRFEWARKQHPLRVYGLVEFGIAICGILALFGMPLVDGVYTAAVGHGMPAILLRALVCACCLMPPTFLMGASLPAAARWIQTSPEGVSWMGYLYGGNTVGAVFGCLLAGFYLLRVTDMTTATFVAAALNCVVGAGEPAGGREHLFARRCRRPRATRGRCHRALAGVCHYRNFGRHRPGRRGGLDAPAGPACWAPRSTRFRSFWRCS